MAAWGASVGEGGVAASEPRVTMMERWRGRRAGNVECVFYVSGPACSNTVLMLNASRGSQQRRGETDRNSWKHGRLPAAQGPAAALKEFLMAH